MTKSFAYVIIITKKPAEEMLEALGCLIAHQGASWISSICDPHLIVAYVEAATEEVVVATIESIKTVDRVRHLVAQRVNTISISGGR